MLASLGTRMLPLRSMLDQNELVHAVAYSTLVVASPEYE